MRKKTFKAFLHGLLPLRLVLPWVFFWKGPRAKLATHYGWARSLQRLTPLDEHDRPIPWIPYVAVSFLAGRLSREMAALEFGAGHSTLWLMDRVGSVVSLEHDPRWREWMQVRVGPNVTLVPTLRTSPEEYLAPLSDLSGVSGPYDFVLVDGVHRVEAFQAALGLVGPSGVILLDDSQRPAYAPAFLAAERAGMRRIDFEGHKAASVHVYRSTLFYRPGNCLGI